jgi:predicted nucleotide-binding protein
MTDHATSPSLDPIRIRRLIGDVDALITRVDALDIEMVVQTSQTVVALQASIRATLAQCFGKGTPVYDAFRFAGDLYVSGDWRGANRRVLEDLREEAEKNINRALHQLREVQLMLPRDLAEAEQRLQSAERSSSRSSPLSTSVFVVHGHDSDARKDVALFLERLGFTPIVLSEQASQGGTVIEAIEANRDVGFAVVLLTPDDVGRSNREERLQSRARQNVVLELGYFMAHLSRKNICLLKSGELEIPSDIAGMLWVPMEEDSGWKGKLAENLEKVGHTINWKTVRRL